ncbi:MULTISPECIES: YeeE/YedE family protein [unclassified Polynucleobacter]|uniref:YeeE/YedE family protein n=1 Tax=unclassified Polynucleobacter TaxID=2640945 RepID=UPI001BFD4779|nr:MULTISPECIES: YeeE/YedE family protein [unclassified Polynucleobacter]MEA9604108.1 YeeE/YedE family protein [Polynucleobacter sp. JS-JIR-II-c23]QWE03519.1 YeeE/YedE family protein [Polynucleobacter sp. JS-JIR-II-b4]
MQIDWISFTPIPSLIGGMILGVAAALYMLLHGRILGISGIVSGLLNPQKGDVDWRVSIVLGILSAPVLAAVMLDLHAIQVIDTDWFSIMAAGLLVGFGAQYGSGCTSGHGICGLSRLSPRSMAATMLFMSSGFMATFIIRHIIGA